MNKPKGLKVAKEDQKADRYDGRYAERGRERQKEQLRGFCDRLTDGRTWGGRFDYSVYSWPSFN